MEEVHSKVFVAFAGLIVSSLKDMEAMLANIGK